MKQSRADYVLLSYFIILLIFGLVMLTSASSPLGQARFGDSYYYIKRQLLYGVLPGLFAFFIFAKLDYHLLKKWSLSIFIFIIFLLILVFIPGIGSTLGTGTHSWLKLAGHSLQPSEFTKLGLIIFLAAYLSKVGKDIANIKLGFLPALLVGMIPVVLVVLQPDIGTVSILFRIFKFIFGSFFSLAKSPTIYITTFLPALARCRAATKPSPPLFPTPQTTTTLFFLPSILRATSATLRPAFSMRIKEGTPSFCWASWSNFWACLIENSRTYSASNGTTSVTVYPSALISAAAAVAVINCSAIYEVLLFKSYTS